MPSFSATDAAFEGFRFTRERPAAVVAWAGATLAFNLASGILGTLLGGKALWAFYDLAQQQAGLGDLLAALVPAWPALAATLAVALIGATMVYGSALRSFIGIDHRVSFRFGEDEGRIMALMIGYFLIYFVVTVATAVVFALAENIASAFSPWFAGFLGYVAKIAFWAAPTVVIVRLSLAPVIAIDRKRISLKESWVSTEGHFWPLAFSLAISIILFFVAAFVALMLMTVLTELLSLGTGGATAKPGQLFGREKAAGDLLTPAVFFGEVITAASVGALLPFVLGPLVRAYQAYDAPDAPATPVHA